MAMKCRYSGRVIERLADAVVVTLKSGKQMIVHRHFDKVFQSQGHRVEPAARRLRRLLAQG